MPEFEFLENGRSASLDRKCQYRKNRQRQNRSHWNWHKSNLDLAFFYQHSYHTQFKLFRGVAMHRKNIAPPFGKDVFLRPSYIVC